MVGFLCDLAWGEVGRVAGAWAEVETIKMTPKRDATSAVGGSYDNLGQFDSFPITSLESRECIYK